MISKKLFVILGLLVMSCSTNEINIKTESNNSNQNKAESETTSTNGIYPEASKSTDDVSSSELTEGSSSIENEGFNVIKHPISGRLLEVASSDFLSRMTWEKANEACEDLGSGWRLPKREELLEILQNRNKIGGFSDEEYWSSDEYSYDSDEFSDDIAFTVNFIPKFSPTVFGEYKSKYYKVRAIRYK
jgi:hypothetical protein